MCGVFGFMDTEQELTDTQKSRLIKTLAVESEERGTDASGIAYNHNGKLTVRKRPVAAHRARFRLPDDVSAVLGHTRMATQGSFKSNFNNHPFAGIADGTRFAFAHNGVIWNDKSLSREESLPKTNIQTDSYVAVQLIEKENSLSFVSLKNMAEKTHGTFVYTLLDEPGNFWFVKGDNPLALYRFDNGVFIYASTGQILARTLKRIGWRFGKCEEIKLGNGDILRIGSDGQTDLGKFTPTGHYLCCGCGLYDDYQYTPRHMPKQMSRLREKKLSDEILDCVRNMGLPDYEIGLLLDAGYDAIDIGEMVYDPEFLGACIDEILCDRRMRNRSYMWQ